MEDFNVIVESSSEENEEVICGVIVAMMRSLQIVLIAAFLPRNFAQNRELIPTEAPNNLTLVEIKNRQVTIEWDPVSPESIRGNFRGYVVRTWSHSGSQVYIFPSDVTKADVEFFPYSKNFVTVSARNEKYVGPPSDSISFDAPQLEPNQPKVLTVFRLGAKSLLLHWNKPTHPNGILLGYKIYCTLSNDSSSEVSHEIFDPDKLQAKLTGFEEGVLYEVAISAINCAGESKKKSIEVILEPHVSMQPTHPRLTYKIGYKILDRASRCENFLNLPGDDRNNDGDGDYYDLTNDNETKHNEITKNETHCFVDLMIMWIPDVRNTPGEYFYVKHRIRGDENFHETKPELSEDYTIIHDFNACKNYEIILIAVDGEFSTESDLIVTPTTIF